MTTATDARVVSAGITAEEYKLVFRHHAAGVALITADAGNGPAALTATSVTSISAEPPLLGFSVTDESSAAATLLAADTVVVHLLTTDQLDLARLGATSGIDRFADTGRWTRLPTGEPWFPEAGAWVRGRVVNRLRVGASTLLIVRALDAAARHDTGPRTATPLVYTNRRWYGLPESAEIRV
nr:flavin reductase family protein [Propionicimonas sp.]